MNSPFLWRNLGILFIVVANFALIVRVLLLQKGRSDFRKRPEALKIFLRAMTILYAVASLIILLMASLVFYLYECTDDARESWKNLHKWTNIKVGMTEQEVLQILGPPGGHGNKETPYFVDGDPDDVYIYQMRSVSIEKGIIVFKIDATSSLKEIKVIEKYPDDETVSRTMSEWLPPDPLYSFKLGNISSMALVFSAIGLLILALLSLIPFGLPNGWISWTLYTPLIALMLGLLYEMNVTAGWRFDLFLLFPIYTLIMGCWLFRFVKAVRLSRKQMVTNQVNGQKLGNIQSG
jgi:hypothetical protein